MLTLLDKYKAASLFKVTLVALNYDLNLVVPGGYININIMYIAHFISRPFQVFNIYFTCKIVSEYQEIICLSCGYKNL